jgi:6-phosphogluconolactonase/glucosamine-6-phosphate isomerase/deaminase
MQFMRQSKEVGQQALAEALLAPLAAGKKVLWLVPGGSNIQVAVEVMSRLTGNEQNLTITLTDERYGKVGHADSNWQQLIDFGFHTSAATIYPVISEGMTLQETAEAFEAFLRGALDEADVVVGFLGMGADGHTAGILPHSPASDPTNKLVVGYQTEQFDRVTTTFEVLQRLDAAFCFAYGEDKRPALERLQQDVPMADQPAQILKHIPEAYVYNDQLGENCYTWVGADGYANCPQIS